MLQRPSKIWMFHTGVQQDPHNQYNVRTGTKHYAVYTRYLLLLGNCVALQNVVLSQ